MKTAAQKHADYFDRIVAEAEAAAEKEARDRESLTVAVRANPAAFANWAPLALFDRTGLVIHGFGESAVAVPARSAVDVAAQGRGTPVHNAEGRVRAFRPEHGGLLLRGRLESLTDEQRCGVNGCLSPLVKGAGGCRFHGGAQTVLKRRREELKRAQSPAKIERILRRLERANRNAATAYRDDKPRTAQEDRNREAERELRAAEEAARMEAFDPAILKGARRVAAELRKYRAADAGIAGAKFAMRVSEDPHFAFDVFASELSLTTEERKAALQMLEPVVGTSVVGRIRRAQVLLAG